MTLSIEHLRGASFFSVCARELQWDEARHTSFLATAQAAVEANAPFYRAIGRHDGRFAGALLVSPSGTLDVAAVDSGDAPGWVEDLAGHGVCDLRRVLGAPGDTAAFAHHLGAFTLAGSERILELQRSPETVPSGRLRPADPDNIQLVTGWLTDFLIETGQTVEADIERGARNLVEAGRLHLLEWQGKPVSMAGIVARTPHGVRLSLVFTPPPFRRRGFAMDCVASLSAQCFRDGASFCCLHVDRRSPQIARIYERIGYHEIGAFNDWRRVRSTSPGTDGESGSDALASPRIRTA